MFSKNNSEFFAQNTDEEGVPFFSKQNSESTLEMNTMNDFHAPGSYYDEKHLNYLPATNINITEYENLVNSSVWESNINDTAKAKNFLPQGAETNIDYVISSTQNEIKNKLNENKFEEIIKYLNSNFQNFLLFNREILYLLMKMKFFDLLFIIKDIKAAEDYYFEYFMHLGKETRKNWERKNKTFLKLLKNPSILKDKNVFAKNKEDFMLELNRALFKYLYEYNFKNNQNIIDDDNSQISQFSRAESGMIKDRSSSDFNDSQLGNFGANQNYNENNNILQVISFGHDRGDIEGLLSNNNLYSNVPWQIRKQSRLDSMLHQINGNQIDGNIACTNNQNQEDIKDISQLSTKEEFSDFEDEIENHEACVDRARENLLSNNEFNNNLDENINLHIPVDNEPSRPIQDGQIINLNNNLHHNLPHLNIINQSFIDFIEHQTKFKKNNIGEISIAPLTNNSAPINNFTNDKNCTHKIYTKEFIPKTLKNVENLQKKLPMLQSFKPKYTKRENVDKKIIRRFKLFLKEKNKDKTLVLKNFEKHFWMMFLNGNLFPPMKYTDSSSGEFVDFKSFNTKYLLWVFSKKGAKELYEKFLLEEGSGVIANISSEYEVHDSKDLKQLESYVYNFANIFDLGSVATTKSRTASGNDNELNFTYNCEGNFTQAPTPDIPSKFKNQTCLKNLDEISKPTFSKANEEDFFYDDDILKLDRKLERSRELYFWSCDLIGDSHYDNSDSDKSEE